MSLKAIKGKIESQELNDNFSYLDSTIRNIDKGSPKGVFDTVQQLKSTYPNGDSGIYVVGDSWYFWDGSDWVKGGVYQAQGVGDRVVSPPKTTFFTNQPQNKNLFNGVYVDGILAVRTGSPDLKTWKNFEGFKGKTAVIKISKDTNYALKSYAGNTFRVGLFKNEPVFGTSHDDASSVAEQVARDSDINSGVVFNSGDNEWVAVYVSNNGTEAPLQLEKGDKITDYEPSQYIPKEFLGKISINWLDFLVRSDNLFDGIYKDGILSRRFTSNQLQLWENYNNFKGKYAIFELDFYTDYSLKLLDQTNGIFRAGLFESEPTPGTTLENSPAVDKQVAKDSDINNGVSFNSENYRYLAVYVSNNGSHPSLYLGKGSDPNADAKAPFVIPSEYLEVGERQNDEKPSGKRFVFYEDMQGTYDYPEVTEGVEVGSIIDIRDKSSLWFWGKYDDLMSQYPDYITKKRIGYGSAEDGSEDTNLPIYEYTFKPIKSEAASSVQEPLFLGQSAFHGNEKGSAWALYLFMKEISEAEDRSDAIGFLRRNITFKIVPIINPWGFDRFVRKNVRNIDMNNNFETDFKVLANKEADYYGGEVPMTEQETLTMDRWYAENSGQNTIGLVDMHNFLTLRDNMLSWNISRDEEVRTILQGVGTDLDRRWKRTLPGLENIEGPLQWTEQRISGTARNQAYKKYGIPSVTIDPLRRIKNVTGAVTYDKYSIQVSLDILGATVVGMIRNFTR